MTTVRLLFTSSRSGMDKDVLRLDGGKFGHVSLMLNDMQILESTPYSGVHINKLHDRLKDSYYARIACLHAPNMLDFRHALGKPFDWNWLHGKPRRVDAFSCTTLIADVLQVRSARFPECSVSELLAMCF